MKNYIQIICCLVFTVLGVFVGGYISIGKGSAAILGGILGFILFCLISWFGSRWYKSVEKIGFKSDSQETLDHTAGLRSAKNLALEEEMRQRLKSPW